MISNFGIDHPVMAEAKAYLDQLLQEAAIATGDHVSTARLTLTIEFAEHDDDDGAFTMGARNLGTVEVKGKVEAKRTVESGSAFIHELVIHDDAGVGVAAELPLQQSFGDLEDGDDDSDD